MSNDSDMAWPEKGKQLFVEGNEDSEFSHFGWGSLQSQLVGYMDGYKEAADNLMDQALQSKDIRTLDIFVFPTLFLYRQYLELVMKYVFLVHAGASTKEKQSALNEMKHDLARCWNKIMPLLLKDASEEEARDVETVGDYVRQFHAFDRSSFTFRYPMTMDLSPVLRSQKRLDLPNLRLRMNELANFFDGAIAKLDAMSELDAEIWQMLQNHGE